MNLKFVSYFRREAYILYPVDKTPFRDDCIEQMEHAYDKFVLRNPYTEEPQSTPPFEEVVAKVSTFMVKFMRDDT